MTNPQLGRAARALGRSLSDEVYVLLPDDETKRFVGEAVLIGIAGSLIAAFVKGLTASAEGRVEEWGKQLGSWILDRVESVVGSDDPVSEGTETELPQAVAEARAMNPGKSADPTQVAQALIDALTSNGMSATEAARMVSAVGAQADALLNGAAS